MPYPQDPALVSAAPSAMTFKDPRRTGRRHAKAGKPMVSTDPAYVAGYRAVMPLDPVLDAPATERDKYDDALAEFADSTPEVEAFHAHEPEAPAAGWHRYREALARAQAHPCDQPVFEGSVIILVVGEDGVRTTQEVTKHDSNVTCILGELANDERVQHAGIVARLLP